MKAAHIMYQRSRQITRTGVGACVGAGAMELSLASVGDAEGASVGDWGAILRLTEMHDVGEMEVDGKPEGERDDEGETLGLGVVSRQWKNPAPLPRKSCEKQKHVLQPTTLKQGTHG